MIASAIGPASRMVIPAPAGTDRKWIRPSVSLSGTIDPFHIEHPSASPTTACPLSCQAMAVRLSVFAAAITSTLLTGPAITFFDPNGRQAMRGGGDQIFQTHSRIENFHAPQ